MTNKTKAAQFVNDTWDISVTGRNVLVTDAMKNYAMEKVARIEKFTPRIVDVNVTMDIQKLEHRVDIIVKVNNFKIKSHAATDDMYASIDKAVAKLEAQLLRYKQKIQDHHARGVKTVEMTVNVIRPHLQDEINDVNSEIEDETLREEVEKYKPHKIVAQEKRQLKFLTYDEAITKMELSGDPFLVFRSEEDHKIRIIYRRKDSNYGIIEPEA